MPEKEIDKDKLSKLLIDAESGSAEALTALGIFYYDNFDEDDTENGKINKLAFETLEQAAKKGSVEAGFYLAKCYAYEVGVKKDKDKAKQMLEDAGKKGCLEAYVELGDIYYFFIKSGDKKSDYEKAEKYYLLANGIEESWAPLGRLYKRLKRYDEAAKWFEKAVEKNDSFAMVSMSEFYEKGLGGVGVDFQKAFALAEKASHDEDYTYAKQVLGKIYEDGIITPRNLGKAASLYLQAAKENENFEDLAERIIKCYKADSEAVLSALGGELFKYFLEIEAKENSYAQMFLGDCYFSGDGVESDKIKAAVFYENAIRELDENHERSYSELRELKNDDLLHIYSRLAKIYKDGADGIAPDEDRAFNYSRIADIIKEADGGSLYGEPKYEMGYLKESLAGDAEADYRLGIHYAVAKKHDLQLRFLQKAAAKNHSAALKSIGSCYQYGKEVKEDINKAIEYYEKAAALGNGDACKSLGWIYRMGVGGKMNKEKAKEWYEKGTELGDEDCKKELSRLFSPDERKRLEAAEKGDAAAQVSLGDYYAQKAVFGKEYIHNALKWYTKALEQGSIAAMFRLGESCFYGTLAPQNYDEAFKLYMRAFEEMENGKPSFGFKKPVVKKVVLCYKKGFGTRQDKIRAAEYARRAKKFK